MITTLIYFFLALFLLVTIHEYGHFLTARLCGVKVLRFSFGFGKILARFYDKKGTEYVWSLIPVGGYVKMLDEFEGEVPTSERHLAFNNKSIWARMLIIAAGPLFNFIFAFFALWLVLLIGIKSLAPIVEDVKANSIAAKIGLTAKEEILAINGKKIDSWRDFQFALMPLIGSQEAVNVLVKPLKNNQKKSLTLSLEEWQLDSKNPDILDSLGIVPFVPTIPPVVGEVIDDTPAYKAGLQVGDRIEKIAGKPVKDWLDLVDYVKQHADEQVTVVFLRQGQSKVAQLVIASKLNKGLKEGFVGMRSQKVDWPPQWLRIQRQNPLQAVSTAFSQTVDLSVATFTLIGRFITGKLALQSISGPVGIAQGAGESARSGFVYYLSFLALVSISLGVLNLLPIPLLDGGHLLYCVIELIGRRPLSNGVKAIGIYIGMFFMVMLMLLALSNDVSRLLG